MCQILLKIINKNKYDIPKAEKNKTFVVSSLFWCFYPRTFSPYINNVFF